MAKFNVCVTETAQYLVEVEAPDRETAEKLAEAKFLDASDIGVFPCDVLDRTVEVVGDD